MKTTPPMLISLVIILALLVALGVAIGFGGPPAPTPMASINNLFKSLDYSQLPPPSTYRAADGAFLTYREYAPSGSVALGSVVLVHGSSASSNSMHPMAAAFSASGFQVYALDIRGHGASGTKGQIAYVGQLESDLESFVKAIKPPRPSTLVGFSSGGGFVLRFAGSSDQKLFQSYLLLSPFISQDAPNQRLNSGGWATVGIPRIIGLSLLNTMGITGLNTLPVTRFALDEDARRFLTPEYGYNLAANFRPLRDYQQNIMAVEEPCAILAGTDDEAFYTDKLEPLVRAAGKPWPVQLLPGIGHIPLTLNSVAIKSAIELVKSLQKNAA